MTTRKAFGHVLQSMHPSRDELLLEARDRYDRGQASKEDLLILWYDAALLESWALYDTLNPRSDGKPRKRLQSFKDCGHMPRSKVRAGCQCLACSETRAYNRERERGWRKKNPRKGRDQENEKMLLKRKLDDVWREEENAAWKRRQRARVREQGAGS